MPTNYGTYTAPTWTNSAAPALSATGELTALTDAEYAQQLEVGDIILSVRTDFGTDYLKLDGRGFNSADYPDLVPYITSSQYALQQTQISTAKIALYDAYCYHGTWVLVGGIATTSNDQRSNRSPYVFTTTDLNGAWTGQRLSTIQANPGHVTCYNGLWAVAVGSYVYTTTDPSGTWNENRFYANSGFAATDIACGSGTWVIMGYQVLPTAPQIFVTTTPTGSWTGYTPFPSVGLYDNDMFYQVAYGNGTWKVARGDIFTTTTPTSTWTTDYSPTPRYFSVSYDSDNDLWFAGTKEKSGYGSAPTIAYLPSNGTWATVNPTTYYGGIDDIQYLNGKYVALGEWGTGNQSSSPRYKAVWFTDDITQGNWTQLDLTNQQTTEATGLFGYGDNWCAAGNTYYPRTRVWTFNISYDYYVPNVSLDGCNGYVVATNIATMSSLTWVNGSSPYLDEDNMQEITDCAALWQKGIGDIIITYEQKANLGAEWLACDGSTVSRLDYPKLVNLIHAVRGTSGNTTTLPNISVGSANAFVKAL